MWRMVIQTFNGKIGSSMLAQCPLHAEHKHLVQLPEDFGKVPECSAICGQRLDCGHNCSQPCHAGKLHARLVCQEECMREFECGHICKKRCYQTCGSCDATLEDVMLPCGH